LDDCFLVLVIHDHSTLLSSFVLFASFYNYVPDVFSYNDLIPAKKKPSAHMHSMWNCVKKMSGTVQDHDAEYNKSFNNRTKSETY